MRQLAFWNFWVFLRGMGFLVCFLFLVSYAASQSAAVPEPQHVADDFETEMPMWRDFGGNCTHTLTVRAREKENALSGTGCEHCRVECQSAGDSAYIAYPTKILRISSSLQIGMGVRSNRSGIQMLARVVLPYSIDPETGKPIALLVAGGTYSSVNRWQKLRIENIDQILNREVTRRQYELGDRVKFDVRDAFLDHIVLNVFTGAGKVDVYMDLLEISGAVEMTRTQSPLTNIEQNSSIPRDFPALNQERQNPVGNAPAASVPRDVAQQYAPAAGRDFSAGSDRPNDVEAVLNESSTNGTNAGGTGAGGTSTGGSGTFSGSGAVNADADSEFNPEAVSLNPAAVAQYQPARHQVEMQHSIITVDKKPIFVRAIRHHGESLEFLHSLGFNTVWLEEPPTRTMEAEAALLKMWFICPPPVNLTNLNADPSQIVDGARTLNRLFNRVLLWDMGRTPTLGELRQNKTLEPTLRTPVDFARQQMSLLHQIPENQLPLRPNIVIPDKDFNLYDSIYDVMMFERSPLNSTMSFVSYGLWFREMLNMVRARQSIFARVPTQFDPLLRDQWRQMAAGVKNSKTDYGAAPDDVNFVPDSLPLEQIRLFTYNVVMAGSRGILYESSSRLDASDEETVFRAKSLTLVNLELLILEQWISQGDKFTTLPSNHPDVAGALLVTNHVRILIPLMLEQGAQYVCGAGAERKIEFLIRGLPETYQCWQYSLNGLSPIPNRRTAGGVKVELDELPLVTTIVMTQNSLIINSISARAARYAPRLAQLMKELAEMRLRSYLQFHGTSDLKGNEAMWYERAKIYLEGAGKALYNHEYADAFVLAQRAMRPIAYMERRLWKERTARFPSPNFQPSGVSFRTLRLQEKWLRALDGMQPSENILPMGGFEDLEQIPRFGWRHFQKINAYAGITTRTDVLPEAAHSGNLGVKFEIRPIDRKTAPMMFDSPPIMLQSPPVFAGPSGTVYEVEAWVNIPARLVNSIDGLKITDSNSGDVLAERVLQTNGWQKISFQRIVKNDKPVYITISMNGYGTAFVDDVQIRPLK